MARADLERFDERELATRCVRGDERAVDEAIESAGAPLARRVKRAIARHGLAGLPRDEVVRRAVTSAAQRLVEWPAGESAPSIVRLLLELEIEDLTLAVACAHGRDRAWVRFRELYGGFLRASAYRFVRHARDVDEIVEGFYADLFLPRSKAGRPICGYQGWSKLRTWLRTVLLYRIRDSYARRHEVVMSAVEGEGARLHDAAFPVREREPVISASEEFHRRHLRDRVGRALTGALDQLEEGEADLIVDYYMNGRTVGQLGARCGVHKASISRWLKRVRSELLTSLRRALGSDFPQTEEEVTALLRAVRTPGAMRTDAAFTKEAPHAAVPEEKAGRRT